ncbi:hypothetical protein Btru_050457, partial [Bulinus truncatus]
MITSDSYRQTDWPCSIDELAVDGLITQQGNSRLRFDLDKLKDPEIAEMFRVTIRGKLAPLTGLYDSKTDIDVVTDTFNSK